MRSGTQVILILLVVILLTIPIQALDRGALLERHRTALSRDPQNLSNLSNIRISGTVEKYGLRGAVTVTSVIPDRFLMNCQYRDRNERLVVRGKSADAQDLSGWRRTLSSGELSDAVSLGFILGYQYLKGLAAVRVNIQEGANFISASFTPVEGTPLTVLFDPQTFLIRSFAFNASDGTLKEYFFENYIESGGIKIPMRIRESGLNPVVYNFEQALVNTSIESSSFVTQDQPAALAAQEKKPIQIPLENYFGMPIIRAWIGNSSTLTFVLDLGQPFSIIDTRIASQLGLHPEGNLIRPNRYPISEFAMVLVPSFQLREVEVKGAVFFATNMTPPSTNVQTPIHGIIGADFFRHNMILLDMSTDNIRVYNLKDFKPGPKAKKVSLIDRGGVYSIPVRMNGLDYNMEITTTTGDSVVMTDNSDMAAALAQRTSNPVKAFSLGMHYGLPDQIYKLDSFSIGDMTLSSLFAHVVQYPPDHPFSKEKRGWIGSGVWKRFLLWFDFASGSLSFEPNQAYDEADCYNTTGCYVVKAGGKIVVQRITPGSAAEKAGLQVGDVITQIQEFPSDQFNFDRIYSNFCSEKGKSFPLRVQRGEDALTITVVTESPY